MFDTLQDAIEALQAISEGRIDGTLKNALIGLGGDADGNDLDVEAYNTIEETCRLTREQQDAIICDDSIASRVVTHLPNQAASGGWSVSGCDQNDKIQDWAKKAKLSAMFREASRLANIYDRGAGIILGVDDGRPWTKPIDRNNIKAITLHGPKHGFDLTPQYLLFTAPVGYTLNLPDKAIAEDLRSGMLIHPDRVLWFPGVWVPAEVEKRRQGSPSLLSQFWKHYARWELASKLALNLVARTSIVNYQIKDLNSLLVSDDPVKQKELTDRLSILKRMASLGIILSDMDKTKVEVINRALGEIPAIIDRIERGMVAASGMTKIELFGFAEGAGLSADDVRDRMFQAQRVKDFQSQNWQPHLETLVGLWLAMDGVKEDEWSIEFESTLIYTQAEQIALLVAISGVLSAAAAAQAITPDDYRAVLNQHPLLRDLLPGKAPTIASLTPAATY